MEINWSKDYQDEFICPHCDNQGLRLAGKDNYTNRKLFRCPNCRKRISQCINIKFPNAHTGINWNNDYRIGEFACPNPNCNSRDIRLSSQSKNKQFFRCNTCGTSTRESIDITPSILSQYAHKRPIKPFSFQDNQWDIRAIKPPSNQQEKNLIANFETVKINWFRNLAKNYIYHLCKFNKPTGVIEHHLINLRVFSRYLAQTNIHSMNSINRSLILDFLTWDKTGSEATRKRLGTLRDFFWTGNIQNWFEIDQDLIRDDDYPLAKVSNPDPIPDSVREQIESNLHKLPEPIARMWIIAFFTAMRPNELALLKKDCLVQVGSNWSLIWQRQKNQDFHEVPITRIVAKVVQEQLEYIEQLWGQEWNYLFCHYQRASKTRQFQNLKPVKKVIPKNNSLFSGAIKYLIETEDIRDENGKLAKFSPCLIRPTRLTQIFEQGHDLAVVSAWAGHKRLATTSNFYTQVSCELIEKEAGYILQALFNADGQYHQYESLPKSFWQDPLAHKLDLPGDHINTPIYGYCGLPLAQRCHKFRACYTCNSFVAVPEKLSQYIKTRDELRAKESRAKANGQDVLVEQFARQADQLDKIILSLQEVA